MLERPRFVAGAKRSCRATAGHLAGPCGRPRPGCRFSCPTLLSSDSLVYLALRRLDDTIWQVGAHGFGPHAARLADDMNDLVTGWDQEHRHGAQPQIAVYAGGTFLPDIDATRLIVPRRHRLIAVTWPTGNHR